MEMAMRAVTSFAPGLIFFIVFYVVSFYMLYNLFIGVILEEFELTDEEKQGLQLGNFRVHVLKEQIKAKMGTDKEFEIARIEQRIQKLRGAVARIFIGGSTEAEIEDKRLRYEDSINALKGGIAEGMVPGGGACFAFMLRYADECRATFDLSTENGREEAQAVDILIEAMSEPCRMIASNAGEMGEMVLRNCMGKEWGYGFNAKTLVYEDLYKAGVVDPASVTTWSLQNAASIAGSLLTTEALVCVAERPEDQEEYKPGITNEIGADAARMAW